MITFKNDYLKASRLWGLFFFKQARSHLDSFMILWAHCTHTDVRITFHLFDLFLKIEYRQMWGRSLRQSLVAEPLGWVRFLKALDVVGRCPDWYASTMLHGDQRGIPLDWQNRVVVWSCTGLLSCRRWGEGGLGFSAPATRPRSTDLSDGHFV